MSFCGKQKQNKPSWIIYYSINIIIKCHGTSSGKRSHCCWVPLSVAAGPQQAKITKYIFTTLITIPPTDHLLGPFLPIAWRQVSKSGSSRPGYSVYFIFSFHNCKVKPEFLINIPAPAYEKENEFFFLEGFLSQLWMRRSNSHCNLELLARIQGNPIGFRKE